MLHLYPDNDNAYKVTINEIDDDFEEVALTTGLSAWLSATLDGPAVDASVVVTPTFLPAQGKWGIRFDGSDVTQADVDVWFPSGVAYLVVSLAGSIKANAVLTVQDARLLVEP